MEITVKGISLRSSMIGLIILLFQITQGFRYDKNSIYNKIVRVCFIS
ncbi:unnamed protein product [Paramecium sonneborni]|uniref:Uncharacterized protein n=1 Tax=Paramecium sonneborni TaxID=65129 RepID=A0A8S1LZU3_9CILI|nr:unnamed protein product [Paramecium sonneborni]